MSRYVVEPGFCSWHVWEVLSRSKYRTTKRRIEAFTTRAEARKLAHELNERTMTDGSQDCLPYRETDAARGQKGEVG